MENNKESIDMWKQEIVDAEASFAEMAGKEGIHKAFVAFAADDAVLQRNNNVVIGKDSIDRFYGGNNATGLNWKPDFVEVSKSGDLGYTYGKYSFTSIDTTGQEKVSTGIFHTVWKRQSNGSWRFVWD
jgi:ketosteroid isomerase-like protein